MTKAKNRTIFNVICSVLVLVSNIVISLWLSPFIIKNIGVEANGFVSLASNFVSYASLIVTALNSMAARFITVSYVEKDYKKANLYYNSVFWGNLVIVAVLIFPAIYFVAQLDSFVNVPSDILTDVKMLFTFVFSIFFMQTAAPNWSCGTYVTNRLDRTYIPNIIFAVLKAVLIFSLMYIFKPTVWYIGLVNFIIAFLDTAVAWYNTHTLTPELRVYLNPKKAICSWQAIKDLVGSGIWGSVSNVGSMLLSGLDLIICNIFIGPTQMGILSLSKTLPHLMQSLSASICHAFAPELVINYAQGNKDKVLRDINRSMKLTSVVLIIPLAGIIVMSVDFYRLWVPSQDANLLSMLTTVTCLGYAFTSGTQILYNVFSTVNKVKLNAILMMASGAVSTALVFVLLKTTNLGIFAIAGVSVVVSLVRNMLYTIPYTAKYLGFKKTQFLPQIFSCVLSTCLLSFIGIVVKQLFSISTWIDFILVAGLLSVIFLIINVLVFLKKDERSMLFEKIKRRFGR